MLGDLHEGGDRALSVFIGEQMDVLGHENVGDEFEVLFCPGLLDMSPKFSCGTPDPTNRAATQSFVPTPFSLSYFRCDAIVGAFNGSRSLHSKTPAIRLALLTGQGPPQINLEAAASD